jgi:trimeric autotransporter adhesin
MTRRSLRVFAVGLTAIAATMAGAVTTSAEATYSNNPSFAWVPNRTVFSMAESGGVIYLGGGFDALVNPTTGQRVVRRSLAALDASTGELLPWNPGADDRVRSLTVGPDGTIYAGGDFLNAAGRPASRLAAINPDGSPVAGWDASANRTVRQIRVVGNDVYVAGNFGNISGRGRNGIAKLAASDGTLDRDWDAIVGSGKVRALAVGPDSTMIVGGSFLSLSGQPREFLGAVSQATGAVTNWHPSSLCGSCVLLDLDAQGRTVFAAAGGGSGGRAASYSVDSDTRLWRAVADGDVQSVAAADDGTVYFGGHFGPTFSSNQRHQLARMTDGGALLDYRLSITGNDHPGTWDLIADHGQLHVGGGFRMAGLPTARYGRFALI